MLAIRLKRVGKKKKPTYRIIVNEKSKDPWGDYKESLGTYNPHTKEVKLKEDRIKEYLANGAEASETVWNLLISNGVVDGKKRNVTHLSKKRQNKLAEAEEKVKEATEAEATPEGAESVEATSDEEKSKEEAHAEPAPSEAEVVDKEDVPLEEKAEEKKEDAPVKEAKEEVTSEEKAEDKKEEAGSKERAEEATTEDNKSDENTGSKKED